VNASPSTAELSYRQVLRNRRLAILLAGDAVAKIGEGMTFVALPVLALALHGVINPAFAISLVTAAPYVLPVAINLFFGLGRSRFNPRPVLLADSAVRAVVLGGLGLLSAEHSLTLWSLALVLFAGSPLRLLADSSRRLIATGMVGDNGKLAVNGLLGVIDNLALYVAGPALGGVFLVLGPPGGVLLAAGAGYVVMLVAAIVAIPRFRPERDETAEPGAPESPTRSGWAIIRSQATAFRLMIVAFVFDLLYGPVEVALPLLVTRGMGADSQALGVLWTSFGVGALAGALLTNQLRRLSPLHIIVAIIAGWAACVGVLATATTVLVAAIALGVGGLIYGPFIAIAYSLLQRMLRPDEEQPVFTLWTAATTVALPLGLGLGGPLVAWAGVRGGLIISCVTTAVLAVVAAWWLSRPRTAPS
jgi:MFS family permease